MDLSRILFVLGVGFLLANLRLVFQFIRFLRLRSPGAPDMAGTPSAVLRDSARRSAPCSACSSSTSSRCCAGIPSEVFGETMMLVYYGYAVPLSLKIGRGFYEDGIWADGGFVPYSRIGGMAWREDEQLTLVLLDRVRDFGRRLTRAGALLRRRPPRAPRQDRRPRHPLHRQIARPEQPRRTRRCLTSANF